MIGIDCFTDYYPKELKERNISNVVNNPKFKLIRKDIVDISREDFDSNEIDVIHHLAAQPGVKGGWGEDFNKYIDRNLRATQQILNLSKEIRPRQVIVASSSSIYGDETTMPLSDSWERDSWPLSTYGITKLATEKLCYAYNKKFGTPLVCLRFFTVFGPRQRPEMAFSKWIRQIINDEAVTVFGSGKDMTRTYTYVKDVIDAMIAITTKKTGFEIFNIGGDNSNSATALEVIEIIERLLNKKARLTFQKKPVEDVQHTFADTDKLTKLVGFKPTTSLEEGLRKQIEQYKREK